MLQVTDTHLGIKRHVRGAPPGWQRADDHLEAFRQALTPAFQERVDLVVHSGDLFDRSKPPKRDAALAVDLLIEVARRVPTVVMPGNHDRWGLIRHLPTHVPGLTVVDEATRIEVKGISLAMIPFFRSAEAFAAAAQGVGAWADALVIHQAVDGVVLETGFRFRTERQKETLGPHHLPRGIHTVMAGHIHPRQVVSLGEATVVYPGSTERTSSVEEVDAKGSVEWRFEGGDPSWRFVDHPTRPMKRVHNREELHKVEGGQLVHIAPELREEEHVALKRGAWVMSPPAKAPPRRPVEPSPQLSLW